MRLPGRRRIAVIGSGISGVSAAWALSKRHDVTLYEAETRPGGHTCTVDVDYDGKQMAVDVGFIVFNERNYPNLTALFDHLGVKSEVSNMSFALSLDGGAREWCGETLLSLFAQRSNLVSPSFWWMLKDILRFNRQCLADRQAGLLDRVTIGDYLALRSFSMRFRDDYLIPMAAAIWSTPRVRMLDFPARAFVSFFENHRLLEIAPPLWQTVSGGSRNYLDRMIADFDGRLLTGAAVRDVTRVAGGVAVTRTSGETALYDDVVMAAHSDQILAMRRAEASAEERSILEAIPYKPNRVVLHRDPGFMPKRRPAWAAWNYLRDANRGEESEICVTYWMNRLQNLDPARPLFVTLNPVREPAPGTIFGEWTFDHPQYDAAAFAAQARLARIQGHGGLWYAGAWTGYGFHEDGLRSGLSVAEALGGVIPWRSRHDTAPANESWPAFVEAAE
ncbi:FAD-dependent oxidoreductase [Oricola sp.]|uniref:NAD(P)/FAD-dependent oxidoreductase n=1 Tax=Oricola sp. TaxID=1979950 RepID=UPI0025CFE7E8|nr:FAD-dependent oxidoreductase [Oricola sp.]MCI5073814.1 FAD-dependent oxidoreductase [Oricola sp.]